MFQHACKIGLEGISLSDWDRVTDLGVSDWLKFKNLDAPAVKREAEEDWR